MLRSKIRAKYSPKIPPRVNICAPLNNEIMEAKNGKPGKLPNLTIIFCKGLHKLKRGHTQQAVP
jgi:hypothetical protein